MDSPVIINDVEVFKINKKFLTNYLHNFFENSKKRKIKYINLDIKPLH